MDSNILRIKRKATEAPLASLGIQRSYNISCIHADLKPSSPVIHESAERAKKRSKQNDGAGVFRLAQTVSRNWAGVGQEAEAFRVGSPSLRILLEVPAELTAWSCSATDQSLDVCNE